MNGSRRNSGSSLVSSSSASSNLSHLEEDTWILWGRIVNEWDEWRKKKEKLLKVRGGRLAFARFRADGKPISQVFHPISPQELIRKGIPHHFRAIVWQLLCSATDMPVKNQYSELLKMSSPCEKLIRRDIARTYPEHEFFKGQDSLGQEVLFNVMKVTSPPAPPRFGVWGAGFGGEELCWALVPTTSSRHRCLARCNRTFSPRAPYSWSSESIRKGIVEFFGVKTELCSDVMRTS